MQFGSPNSILLLVVLFGYSAYGQTPRFHEEVGQPFEFETFADDELPNQGQNWSVVQDDRGLIYVANHYGVLEYDGHSWRLINVAGNQTAFSLGVAEEGRVFVGSRGDLGYLAPDSLGRLAYRSLLDRLPYDKRDFSVIWGAHPTSRGVYFHSWKHIFHWDGQAFRTWTSSNRLHTSFVAHDRFFVKRDSVGLLEMVGDSLRLVPGGERFALTRVFAMLPMQDGSILVGAQKGMSGRVELYRYREGQFVEQSIDSHFRNIDRPYTFYSASLLPGGYIALSTLYTGVLIIDHNGQLIDALEEDRQIPEDVNYSFADRQGGLWLAHDNNGISHIAVPIGLSEFGVSQGLKGNVNDIVRHDEKLYVATDAGLYSLRLRLGNQLTETDRQFDEIVIEEAGKIHWSLLPFDDELIVGTEVGLFSYQGGNSYKIGFSPVERPKILLRSHKHPSRVYAAKENGLGLMVRQPDGWEVFERFGSISKPVTSLAEDEEGSLWVTMGTKTRELWRVFFDEQGNYLSETRITDQTALGATSLRAERIGNEVVVVAPPVGVYKYDAHFDPPLVIDEAYAGAYASRDSLFTLKKINKHRFFAVYNDRLDIGTLSGQGKATRETPYLLQLADVRSIRHMYEDERNGVFWIGYGSRMLRYDPEIRRNEHLYASAEPLIRRASMVWADSVLYGGAFSREVAAREVNKGKTLAINLNHDDNDLRFDVALPDYSRSMNVEYRFMLDGHDRDWSRWTSQPVALYRNVEAGNLQFRVMARVGEQVVPEVATLNLTVRPPWFWTWWSRLAYLLFMALPVYQIVRFQRARKQLVELEKEREVNERLNLANEQLRTANENLELANKMKDEFLASASHELRTPLTAILGFTSVLKEEVPPENMEFLSLIDENGKRLLQTINSLLDLAKLRAGMLELNFSRIDVGEKVEEVVDLLTQLAKNQGLYLEVHSPVEHVIARLDDHCFERILYNLIGNAIKFTQYGGVSVIVERTRKYVLVHVKDTGIGIDENFIPMLFDEFKQEPANHMRVEGSGLGLTITAELVELMDGAISVESKKGVGSTFTVSFPIADVMWPRGGQVTDTESEVPSHSALP